ncbi:hypothetical protein ACFTWF_41790 [Rhodococcus sp. NPDC056960]|uniref:hypothetical protein n=1 Tax=Rhodococcus sp. NPDC056960 TaxID=3345982 RepID=UPI0036382731
MTNFQVSRGDALTSTPAAESGIPLPTIEDVRFLGPGAGFLMMLGAVSAGVGYLSSTRVIGRMTVSKEGTVLLVGLGTFMLGFMAWLT